MAEIQKFPNGTVVQLKSGGPLMTIETYSKGDPYPYQCSWFDGVILRHAGFEEYSLKLPGKETPKSEDPKTQIQDQVK